MALSERAIIQTHFENVLTRLELLYDASDVGADDSAYGIRVAIDLVEAYVVDSGLAWWEVEN